jgi:hypothetical protein
MVTLVAGQWLQSHDMNQSVWDQHMPDDELLRDQDNELILTADGAPIPYSAFENEPSDTYLYLYRRPREERIRDMLNAGITVPKRLLDLAGMTDTGEDKL